jgi:Predicted solute binding protein
MPTKDTPQRSSSSGSSGASQDTGSGHYTQYPRTADGTGGVISFGTSPIVKSVTLPAGVEGEVKLSLKTDDGGPENIPVFLVFDISIPKYPSGETAEIFFVLPLSQLQKDGYSPADVALMHKDSNGSWEILPTTYEISGSKVKYTAVTTAFSPFAIVYTEGGSTPAKTDEPTVQPTEMPTEVLTDIEPEVQPTIAVPEKTTEPTATATQTPASPAPILGLITGVGAFLIFRRK